MSVEFITYQVIGHSQFKFSNPMVALRWQERPDGKSDLMLNTPLGGGIMAEGVPDKAEAMAEISRLESAGEVVYVAHLGTGKLAPSVIRPTEREAVTLLNPVQ